MTLQERIARLNLGSSSANPEPQANPRTTGAQGRIGDKIKKFQEKAEDQPLLPEAPFGLGVGNRKPSGADSRGADKGRVVSLGGGRAAVPIESIKSSRSVSGGYAGIPPSAREAPSGAPASAASSRSASSQGMSADTSDVALDFTTQESVPQSSPVAVSYKAERPDLYLTAKASTPSVRSVSSMDVEGGSYTSERGPDPDSISIDVNQETSPLSSPVLTGIVSTTPPAGDQGMLSPTPAAALQSKGPVSALKAPVRSSPSSVSVSSLAVEIGDDSTDHTKSEQDPSTPKEESAMTDTVVLENDGKLSEEELERRRIAETNAELKKYEDEPLDVAAPPFIEQSQRDQQDSASSQPVMPTWSEQSPQREEDGYGNIIDDLTDHEPKIKCSDCNADIAMTELAEHNCSNVEATDQAMLGSPATPQQESVIESKLPDVASGNAVATPTPSSPAVPAVGAGEANLGETSRIDAFVPQTEALVPDDVLDMYNDDEEAEPTSNNPAHDVSATASLPQDVNDEDEPHGVASSLRVSAPSDMPEDVMDEVDADQVPHEATLARSPSASGQRRVKSVHEARGSPLFNDSEDDDEYDGGSVAIVSRTVASHAPSSTTMTRQSTA
ncbi:hypothetical protein OIV83_001754 [Microbotryomycetes sp. JL201]|nr:hypothetical protein OIV83_001754 [Microbotryomycetes sp. JL201]